MHPILEEILRAKTPPSQEMLKRWQRVIREQLATAPEAQES